MRILQKQQQKGGGKAPQGPIEYKEKQYVWLRTDAHKGVSEKLAPQWEGPYRVEQVRLNSSLVLKRLGAQRLKVVSRCRVKPYYSRDPEMSNKVEEGARGRERARGEPIASTRPAGKTEQSSTGSQGKARQTVTEVMGASGPNRRVELEVNEEMGEEKIEEGEEYEVERVCEEKTDRKGNT
uniref:Uncharacterized protein n=1 Tax=Chromera velia CCMP2878 TaxID=1169474 RepID=A0A0G4H4I3_9ALVE|eukprot:Cvel_5701.t1-p1 / transcript=Cvel_5701.t1 / gene=Cvel_5701 / organism=Chromera_velia_CCMP2878 / gene_product=hypothetical protein / transcript_product=hypothetical protein / location=Cvel_scaffold269:97388-97927(-) / protein_length=180 / sequence_SO=supercontig / SO=protein_coding / is_pseudo=false